jgi:hypothetical protein
MNDEGETRLREATNNYLEALPSEYRGNRPITAHASKFVTGWNNDDQYVIVSRVRSFDEFLKILSSRS